MKERNQIPEELQGQLQKEITEHNILSVMYHTDGFTRAHVIIVGVPSLEFWVLSMLQDVLLPLEVRMVIADPGTALHTDGVHSYSTRKRDDMSIKRAAENKLRSRDDSDACKSEIWVTLSGETAYYSSKLIYRLNFFLHFHS